MTVLAVTGVSVRVSVTDAKATITLEGNATNWFGIGFAAKSMQVSFD